MCMPLLAMSVYDAIIQNRLMINGLIAEKQKQPKKAAAWKIQQIRVKQINIRTRYGK